MLCSERELMVSDDHEGIIDLPGDAPMGVRYIDYAGLNDPVIDIAVTPNRPDALGIAGIARDLAARGLGELITTEVEAVPGSFESPIKVTLKDDVADKACPLFVGRYIRGVKNGPSPKWMQKRLRAIGLRPISALVDRAAADLGAGRYYQLPHHGSRAPAACIRCRQGDRRHPCSPQPPGRDAGGAGRQDLQLRRRHDPDL
jgi:hypothetical protein